MASTPRVAIDFKKIGTPGYRSYRVLSSAGAWAQVYRDRIALVGEYRTAIIFPEQLLGLKQSVIYTVSIKSDANVASAGVTAMRRWNMFARVGYREQFNIDSLDKLSQFEFDNSDDVRETENLIVASNDRPFVQNPCLFTGKEDAIKFVRRYMEAGIRKL